MKQTKLRRFGIIMFWLFVWHLLALWVDNSILLVTPVRAACVLVELLGEITFWQAVCGSLLRIGAGFLMGTIAALVLAVLARRFRWLEELLEPLINLLKAIPVASFVVLLLIWWGSSFLAVAVCFLIVLPNIYISTLEGLKNADKRLLEMAAVFQIPFKNCFFYIYCPALKPFLLSSLKVALGMCWKSGVAAEVIGTPAFSIGERLYMSKIYLETAEVFAWTAVVILLSFCFEKAILWLVRAFFDWEPECSAPRRVGDRRSSAGREADRPLICKNISRKYGDLTVIKDYNAVYEAGQIYYLTSPSGSGKTTLLRLLCGLETPDGGSVEPELRFSYCFQEDRLCESYSAVKNVELVVGAGRGKSQKRSSTAQAGGNTPAGENAQAGGNTPAEEALRAILPEEALCKPCSQLSGGMKRRVALVRAMEADSDCVLLDEPFTGMDARTREKAEAYIRSRQQGRIVVIATHI